LIATTTGRRPDGLARDPGSLLEILLPEDDERSSEIAILCNQKMKCSPRQGQLNGVNRIVLAALVVEKNQKYFRRHESFQVFKDFPLTENKYREMTTLKYDRKSVHTMWANVSRRWAKM